MTQYLESWWFCLVGSGCRSNFIEIVVLVIAMLFIILILLRPIGFAKKLLDNLCP